MLLVTRWLQALTISYLIGLFEIMLMPKRNIFFGTITANKSNGSFILRIKNKGDLRVERCHSKVMIKTKKNKFSISFGSELKLIYNLLKTVQKGKNCSNKLLFILSNSFGSELKFIYN